MAFALFTGPTYYPLGGWEDHQATFPTLEEALDKARSLGHDWHHVVDLSTGEIVEDSRDTDWPEDSADS